MNKLSALGIAGALLLGASVPALAQSYPVDPGYDQGPDYGPPEAPGEDLRPGMHFGPGPIYRDGYADRGPYREDEYGDAGPDPYRTFGDEGRRRHPRHYDRPEDRYGEDLRQGGEARSRGQGYRWPDGEFGSGRGPRDRNADQHRRRHPSDEDMSDEQ